MRNQVTGWIGVYVLLHDHVNSKPPERVHVSDRAFRLEMRSAGSRSIP